MWCVGLNDIQQSTNAKSVISNMQAIKDWVYISQNEDSTWVFITLPCPPGLYLDERRSLESRYLFISISFETNAMEFVK